MKVKGCITQLTATSFGTFYDEYYLDLVEFRREIKRDIRKLNGLLEEIGDEIHNRWIC